jgi:gamma-glutamyltranspeptidase/glutathione hydrolase
MPPSGTAAELGLRARAAVIAKPDAIYQEPEPDTSYICAMDRWGNAFSATPSDGATNGPVVPGTGIAPSSRGMQSWTDPAHPACLAPGKRPRLTPSPSMVVGDSGWGMTMQQAIEQPRFASASFPSSSDPHIYTPGRMSLERRFDDDTAAALERKGHGVTWWRPWEYKAGAVCAIVRDNATGLLEGGADVRRPGGVRGW